MPDKPKNDPNYPPEPRPFSNRPEPRQAPTSREEPAPVAPEGDGEPEKVADKPEPKAEKKAPAKKPGPLLKAIAKAVEEIEEAEEGLAGGDEPLTQEEKNSLADSQKRLEELGQRLQVTRAAR